MKWFKPVVLKAVLKLVVNFLKLALLSGLDTARLILRDGKAARGELVVMPFGSLPVGSASVLGAMITLTPGTTLVSLDLERREFVLHMLEPLRQEEIFADIERDFCHPLQQLSEAVS